MITNMNKEDVIALGVRNRAAYLIEQAGYTLGLARLDGAALDGILPAGYRDELAACAASVSAALKDRVLAGEEAKGSTRGQNEAMRRAKVWRRAAASRANRARRLGNAMPAGLLTYDRAQSVPAVAEQVENMAQLLEANASAIPGGGLEDMISEGRALAAEIKAMDAVQEVKLLKSLPDAVRRFYHEKGLLFTGIKVINDAGRELHAGNPTDAAKYNLSILYRNTGRKKPEPAGA